MTFRTKDSTRDLLSRTLPMVRQHKEAMIGRIAWTLRGVAKGQRRDYTAISTTLAELLIDQAHSLAGSGRLRSLDGIAEDHRALGIDGRYYSRFGDALVPVLADLLGPNVPGDVPAAWCDAFWMVIRAIKPVRMVANG